MKILLLFLSILFYYNTQAQKKIDSIFVNLYTDSLKIGTYNYINVDGLMSDGSYRPLDSSTIVFNSDAGKFFGNNLWVNTDFKGDKIRIKLHSKQNDLLCKDFVMYIKKSADPALLTADELMKNAQKNKRRGGN